MMRWLVNSSIQFRFLVLTVAVILMTFGITRLRDMPVDVLPEFAPPFVEIQTEALGLSATEVEQLISLNLEELLSGTPWLQTIRSESVPGLSSLVLIFQPGTDILRARQLVQERLTLAHMLPNVSRPPVILQPLSATSRVMMVGMTSKDVSPIELGVLARWKIRPALMGVQGVASVSIWGQRERQLQVQVDPQQLRAQGVTLDQVIRTAGDALWVSPLTFLNASTPGTGGWIDTPQQRLEVRHVLPISKPADLARVTVDGSRLLLGDVAKVVENHQPLIGDAIVNGTPGLMFVVEKFPGSNTLEVTRKVEALLESLRPGLKGIDLNSQMFRPASFIELAKANISRTLFIAGLLIVLVLVLFYWNWRVALISAVAIPLSLVTGLLVLSLSGAGLNMMVVAGLVIAVAAIVGDAIMDVENILRRLRQRRQEGRSTPLETVVAEASVEIRHTMLFTTMILLLTVLPIFVLQGVSGSFFLPFALTYVLAVLASMAVALTVTPALGMVLLSHASLERESPFLVWLRNGFDGMLKGLVSNSRFAYLTVTLLVVAGVAMVPLLRQQQLLPAFREPDLMIEWDGAPGTSHPAMVRMTSEVSKEIGVIPGVRNVGAHIGRAILSDQIVGINSAQLWVNIDPTVNYDTTVAAIKDTIRGYPGVAREVRTYLQETLRRTLTGSSSAVVVRIFGPEFATLKAKASEVRTALSQIEGVVDLHTDNQIEEPYVEIEVNLAKAQAYGIKPGDVRRAAATLVNGLEVGSLFEQQKVFEVVVWSIPKVRRSLTDIKELMIDTPGGGHVRLEEVADVRVAPTFHSIKREAVSRRMDVSFNVKGRDLGAVADEVRQRMANISFPLEYHSVVLGEYVERQAAQNRSWSIILVSAIGIFFLLQAAFSSWRLATLAFLTLPLALVGGAIMVTISSAGALTLGSLLGFLMVLGVAVRNGIALIGHYQHLERFEGEHFSPGLVMRGTREQFAPILMTALTTAAAMLPLALFGAIPGQEIEFPLALVVIGGLVTSTIVTLFVMPGLYLQFGAHREADLGIGTPLAGAPGD
jgi:CzcA family heavy metal efflux pump